MTEAKVAKATAIAAMVILALISVLFGISFLISTLLGLPSSLALPVEVRFVGAAMVAIGVAVVGWLFKYRKHSTMIVSTYVTLSKLFRRVPISEHAGRTEPLILSGPQKYVRHPLYSGIIVIVFGWGLMTTTYVLIASAAILIWFRFVIIPFEERELCTLFGAQYTRYMDITPMLVPFTKRKRHIDYKI